MLEDARRRAEVEKGDEADNKEKQEEELISPSSLSYPTTSPTFSRSSILFSDKDPQTKKQDDGEDTSGSMMFKRCRATKQHTTEQGLGSSWMVIKEDDANVEWEVLDGADVGDDWGMFRGRYPFSILSNLSSSTSIVCP